jgi:hypothetical protein
MSHLDFFDIDYCMIIGMYLMKSNDEMLLVDKMLIFDDLFQNAMIVQMDMELIQHYLNIQQNIMHSLF